MRSNYEKMTLTPMPKLIVTLSIPTILSMLVTNIYNLADTAFVGTLGNSASGACGIVFGFMAILMAIGFLFGQGAGSILSRKLGSKDPEGATVTASTGFFSAFFLATAIGLICYLLIDPLVYALGSTETIAPYARTYITCIISVAPFFVTSYTLNNFLRYEGKANLGMIGMMTGAILNIGGDALLILVFKMGILGAGISTAVSQLVSFLILISMFLRGKTQAKISLRKISRNVSTYTDILTTGFPSLVRQVLNSLSTVFLNSQAAFYGDVAVAAMSIVGRIMFFTFSVAMGIGQGFQPVSAFNYGAKKYDRVRSGFKTAITMQQIIMVIMTALVICAAPNLIGIFRDDPDVITIGTRALILQGLVQLCMPACMMGEMLYQSTGHKFGATLLSSLRSGIIFIPVLLFLSKLRGLAGIQEAQPLSTLISFPIAIIFIIRFFRNLPKNGDVV